MPRPLLANWRRQAAFTLMELMVVLGLIAILSAAIIPEMRGSFEDAVLRASARQIVDVFSVANSRAVALSQTHRVRFERTSGKYLVESQAGRASRGAEFAPVRDLSGGTGNLDQRVRFEIRARGASPLDEDPMTLETPQSPESISFYADGTADAAEVWLSDRAGVGLTLRLNPVTARVQVIDRPRP
ncbi:MAG TPA: prepilin-type N-terminal cleavage/methylation domain-containing protein [Verrucomicrobiota bacterium]|nr:prepilin-type N-terminal cleavage/methylation domain-containing protein [Verrucomicrobiota bacterium]